MSVKDLSQAWKDLNRLPEEAMNLAALDLARRMPAQVSKAVRKKYNVSAGSMKSAGAHATASAIKGYKSGKDINNLPFEYTLNELSYGSFKNAVTPKETPETRDNSRRVTYDTASARAWAKSHGMSSPHFRTPKRYKVKAKIRKGGAETIGEKNGHLPFVRQSKRGTDIFYSKFTDDMSVMVKAKTGLSFDSIIKDPDVFPNVQKAAGELFEKTFERRLGQAEKKIGAVKNVILK